MVCHGEPTRAWLTKEDSASLMASLESIIITAINQKPKKNLVIMHQYSSFVIVTCFIEQVSWTLWTICFHSCKYKVNSKFNKSPQPGKVHDQLLDAWFLWGQCCFWLQCCSRPSCKSWIPHCGNQGTESWPHLRPQPTMGPPWGMMRWSHTSCWKQPSCTYPYNTDINSR